MERCAHIENTAGWFKVPIAVNTATEENALSNAIVLQMMGNASGGGIHEGRLRSAIAVFSSEVFGRAAFNGENVLLLNALNRNQVNTIAF